MDFYPSFLRSPDFYPSWTRLLYELFKKPDFFLVEPGFYPNYFKSGLLDFGPARILKKKETRSRSADRTELDQSFFRIGLFRISSGSSFGFFELSLRPSLRWIKVVGCLASIIPSHEHKMLKWKRNAKLYRKN